MANRLNISSLQSAAQAYSNALVYAQRVEELENEKRGFYAYELVRSAIIKHYELAYDLCWKTMERIIEMDVGSDADLSARRNLLRSAAERGLIANFDHWLEYHIARNQSSNVYDDEVAEKVYQVARRFGDDLQTFIRTVEQKG